MALRQVLELGCGAMVIPEQIAIRDADHAFDDKDNLKDDAAPPTLLRAERAAAGRRGAADDVRRCD